MPLPTTCVQMPPRHDHPPHLHSLFEPEQCPQPSTHHCAQYQRYSALHTDHCNGTGASVVGTVKAHRSIKSQRLEHVLIYNTFTTDAQALLVCNDFLFTTCFHADRQHTADCYEVTRFNKYHFKSVLNTAVHQTHIKFYEMFSKCQMTGKSTSLCKNNKIKQTKTNSNGQLHDVESQPEFGVVLSRLLSNECAGYTCPSFLLI